MPYRRAKYLPPKTDPRYPLLVSGSRWERLAKKTARMQAGREGTREEKQVRRREIETRFEEESAETFQKMIEEPFSVEEEREVRRALIRQLKDLLGLPRGRRVMDIEASIRHAHSIEDLLEYSKAEVEGIEPHERPRAEREMVQVQNAFVLVAIAKTIQKELTGLGIPADLERVCWSIRRIVGADTLLKTDLYWRPEMVNLLTKGTELMVLGERKITRAAEYRKLFGRMKTIRQQLSRFVMPTEDRRKILGHAREHLLAGSNDVQLFLRKQGLKKGRGWVFQHLQEIGESPEAVFSRLGIADNPEGIRRFKMLTHILRTSPPGFRKQSLHKLFRHYGIALQAQSAQPSPPPPAPVAQTRKAIPVESRRRRKKKQGATVQPAVARETDVSQTAVHALTELPLAALTQAVRQMQYVPRNHVIALREKIRQEVKGGSTGGATMVAAMKLEILGFFGPRYGFTGKVKTTSLRRLIIGQEQRLAPVFDAALDSLMRDRVLTLVVHQHSRDYVTFNRETQGNAQVARQILAKFKRKNH